MDLVAKLCDDHAIQRLTIDFNTANVTEYPLPRYNPSLGMYSILGLQGSSKWAAFAAVPSLQVLQFRGCNISDEDAVALFASLVAAKQVLALDVSYNPITSRAMQAAAEMLVMNKSLVALTIAGAKITDAGARVLFSAFTPVELHSETARVKKLGWQLTSVKNRVFRDSNATLRHLVLTGNPLGSTSVWLSALEVLGEHAVLKEALSALMLDTDLACACVAHDAAVAAAAAGKQREDGRGGTGGGLGTSGSNAALYHSSGAASPGGNASTVTSGAGAGAGEKPKSLHHSSSSSKALLGGGLANNTSSASASTSALLDATEEATFPLLPAPAPALLSALAQQTAHPRAAQTLLNSLQLNNTPLPLPSMALLPEAQATAVPPVAAVRAKAMGRRLSLTALPPQDALAGGKSGNNENTGLSASGAGTTASEAEEAAAERLSVISAALRELDAVVAPSVLGMNGSRNKIGNLVLLGIPMNQQLKAVIGQVNRLVVMNEE
jgi:hypothetical protein